MVAGFDADGGETIKGFGEFEREELFADCLFAREEQRAGHAAPGEHAAQGLLCALISNEAIKHIKRGQRPEIKFLDALSSPATVPGFPERG